MNDDNTMLFPMTATTNDDKEEEKGVNGGKKVLKALIAWLLSGKSIQASLVASEMAREALKAAEMQKLQARLNLPRNLPKAKGLFRDQVRAPHLLLQEAPQRGSPQAGSQLGLEGAPRGPQEGLPLGRALA